MGRQEAQQEPLWVTAPWLLRSPGYVFHEKLNPVLNAGGGGVQPGILMLALWGVGTPRIP